MSRRLRYILPLLVSLWLIDVCACQPPANSQQASSFTLIFTTDMRGQIDPCG